MSSSTCTNCGFVTLITGPTCPKCGTPVTGRPTHLTGATVAIQESTGIPRIPVYGLPQPASDGTNPSSASGSSIWRRGSVLAFHKSATLPDRCIKCNAPAHGCRVNKTLYWHHPALYLLIFAGLLVYAIVAIFVRKTAKVSLGFCQSHKLHRTRMLLAGWLLFVLSLGAFFASLAEKEASLALVGLTLLIAAVVLSLLGGRFIQLKKIDNHFVYLKGVHPAYLDEFPSI